jgi:ribose 5-phosphate isomerase B
MRGVKMYANERCGGSMKIAMGSDHAGFELKAYLFDELLRLGHEIIDCGTYTSESVDFPDYAEKVCALVQSDDVALGILVCGTGVGISIAANKQKGIRAALCTNEFTAYMARQHNDANVLALGGMVTGKLLALKIAETFISEPFSRGERHIRRIAKMMAFEEPS